MRIDKGTKGVLQAAVTKTSTFNSAGVDLGSGFAPGQDPDANGDLIAVASYGHAVPGQPFIVAVNVTALDTADGNETYSFKLQESADNSSFTDASPATPTTYLTDIGTFVVGAFVKKRYVRLVMTLAGTTPSVTYSAYLCPLKLAA